MFIYTYICSSVQYLKDELVSLDNAVAMEGGTARAFMDDVAVVATQRTGFMAIAEYIKNIGCTAGVCIEKVEVYAPWLDAQTLATSTHRREAERVCGVEFKMGGRPAPGSSSAGDTHLMRGVEFMGAPIGDMDFEEAFYEAKATAVVSKIIDTAEMLHDRSTAALQLLTPSSTRVSSINGATECAPAGLTRPSCPRRPGSTRPSSAACSRTARTTSSTTSSSLDGRASPCA